ncbi:Cochaperone protein [Saxophila tyrrhenica]|uniref:Cochaperone protein n=1 Tax=Saxophila tyrrhenica TaxID=1690608 RepID=A0AAV9P1E5_9PEZI|nr:Cochaperone protein [Saxophila tyrrhenica]
MSIHTGKLATNVWHNTTSTREQQHQISRTLWTSLVMESAAKGKQALANQKYQEAVELYTLALKQSPTSPDYLIHRATAYQRSQDYASALSDAEKAVVCAQKRAKRELIVEAQFRRGCALHCLERYGDAAFVFGVVKRMDEKHKMVATWIGRNEMSLKKLEDGDARKQCTVKETPEVSGDVLEEVANAPTSTSTSQPAAPQQTPADKIRHEWYQNSENVYFTLLAKGVPKDKAQIDIQERSISISFPLVTGSSYDFTLDPLFAPVIPAKCIPRVLPSKIELVLQKANSGQKWSAIESSEPATTTTTSSTDTTNDAMKQAVLGNTTTSPPSSGPAYPTSSKSGPKNWDKVVEDARRADSKGDHSLGDDDEYEGGDESNFFFKKLYKDADDDTKKAMMKSYTESNGTALSTNWEEVKKGKVETSPPDGMEAKSYS